MTHLPLPGRRCRRTLVLSQQALTEGSITLREGHGDEPQLSDSGRRRAGGPPDGSRRYAARFRSGSGLHGDLGRFGFRRVGSLRPQRVARHGACRIRTDKAHVRDGAPRGHQQSFHSGAGRQDQDPQERLDSSDAVPRHQRFDPVAGRRGRRRGRTPRPGVPPGLRDERMVLRLPHTPRRSLEHEQRRRPLHRLGRRSRSGRLQHPPGGHHLQPPDLHQPQRRNDRLEKSARMRYERTALDIAGFRFRNPDGSDGERIFRRARPIRSMRCRRPSPTIR